MENTGFSEINEKRLHYNGPGFWFCEIAVTGACNFSCKYCNGLKSSIDINILKKFIDKYEIKYIHLTGGEPTLYPNIIDLCSFIKSKNIELGLSTNGSADLSLYKLLNVDRFSISLDDYDENILNSRGYKHIEKIKSNIQELSKENYVNVGVVIDSINVSRIEKIINYILNLGVSDIKLSVSTKDNVLPSFNSDFPLYPILNYRVNRFKLGKNMRGIQSDEHFKCGLMLSDISIVNNNHYPCLVYAREGGDFIGPLDDDVLESRKNWYKEHEPSKDLICKTYCMDFKCEFNREFEGIYI